MRMFVMAAILTVSACSEPEPESVEQRAGNIAAQLENRAAELEAAASNGVNATEAELEEEFADFGGNAAETNLAENAADDAE